MNVTIKNLAVFIDLENFREEILDVGCLIAKLKEEGRLIVKRAYADWGRYGRYKTQMLENSVELIELPFHTKRGKNSADIKLAVDALEIAITRDYIDTIVVISGDSDYTPLISKLREYNKYVIVIGSEASTSSLLAGYCDELIYYASIIGIKKIDKQELQHVYSLLVRAIQALEDSGIQPRGSQIKQWMKQVDASFDESNFGFTQFKSFLERAQKDGVIDLEIMGKGGDYSVSMQEDFSEQPETKVETSSKELQESKSSSNFQQLLWSALRLHQLLNSSEEKATMNVISSLVKELEPDFNITDYKYAKKAGFKTMLIDAQQEGFLNMEYIKDKNEYFVTYTDKYASLQYDQHLHQSFFPIYYQKLLQKYDLYYSLIRMEYFYEQIKNILEDKENINLKELFQIFDDDSKFSEISSATCKKFCYFLIKSKYITLSSLLNEDRKSVV